MLRVTVTKVAQRLTLKLKVNLNQTCLCKMGIVFLPNAQAYMLRMLQQLRQKVHTVHALKEYVYLGVDGVSSTTLD